LSWPQEALLDVALRTISGELIDPHGENDGHTLQNLVKPVMPELDVETMQSIAQLCVSIHGMVGNLTEDYSSETKRRIYVTPKSFLDLLHLYRYLLKREKAQLLDRRDKFSTGLTKMSEITVVIESSKRELDLLRPVLEEKARNTQVDILKSQHATTLATYERCRADF